MSSPNQARRVTAQIFFQGADITGSMRPYFLSATYTDKEADGTDDLQLKLQDRDDIWLKKWLADAIDAAASAGSLSASSKAKTDGAAKSYKVTAKSGLNVRSGPSPRYGKSGALVCGAELQVEGISLKATNNEIVHFDQEDYEKKSPVLTIVRGSGSYTKHKLNAGTAGTQYASCRVSYTDPGTGKCIEATVKVEDYNDKAKNNQQLEITAKVASVAEAKTKAEKYLRLHNKYAKTATFTLPGNPDIVSGVTAKQTGWGEWGGK